MSIAPKARPMISAWNLFLLALWSLALFGILQVHQFEGLFGHAVCGPWGCGPPVSALVGYHGFWFLLLLPITAILKHRLPSANSRSLGFGCVLLSAVGLVSLLLIDGLNNSAAENYPLQWCAFRVATFVDLPLVQIGLAGIWMVFTSQKSPIVETFETDEQANS